MRVPHVNKHNLRRVFVRFRRLAWMVCCARRTSVSVLRLPRYLPVLALCPTASMCPRRIITSQAPASLLHFPYSLLTGCLRLPRGACSAGLQCERTADVISTDQHRYTVETTNPSLITSCRFQPPFPAFSHVFNRPTTAKCRVFLLSP